MSEKGSKLTGRQWIMLIVESFGWSGVMVMGYFFSSYYALIQDVFSYTAAQISGLVAVMSGAGAICYILGGVLADAVKPKFNLMISYLGLTACGVITLMMPGYGVMQVLAVLVSVFGLGTYTSSMLKYVASLGDRSQMSRIYGYFYALSALESMAIAPIASSIIDSSGSYEGLRAIVIFFCALMLISMVIHLAWVERKTTLVKEEKQADDKFSFKMLLELLKNPNMYFVIIVGCMTTLPYDLNTYVQPLLASEFDASQGVVQFIASYANNGTALILSPLAGLIAMKLGSTSRVMTLSIVIAILSSAALLVLPWDASYLVLAVVIVVCLRSVFSIGKPARNSMIGESRLPKKARGTVIGLMFGIGGIQSTLVAWAAGALVTAYGTDVGYHILYGGALCIFIVGLAVSLFFTRRLKKAKERDAIEGAPADLMI